ncbi:hypothetical protein E4U57_001856, partial [Claviceps arundinis]
MMNTRRQDQKQKPFSDPKVHQPPQPPRSEDAGKWSTRNFPENRQTQTEEILVNLIEGLTNIPSKVCDELMKRCVKSEKQLVIKSEEAEGLRSELQSLKEQLHQQKADSQEKVAGLTTMIQGLDEDKRKLREVILGNALRPKISDDDIRQRFLNIRQQIQAVVNNSACDKTRRFIPRASGNEHEFRRYQQYNSYSPEDRVFFLRSTVYQIVFHYILSRDAFGLTGSVQPLQCNQEAHLDQFLGDFESLLRTKKGA